MKTELTVAALSMTTTADKAANVQAAVRLVEEAATHGVDWVQLPEMFPFMGGYDRVYDMAEEEGGRLYETLAGLAQKHRIVLFAGTVGERPGPRDVVPEALRVNAKGERRVYNTHYVFGRSGELLAKYRKTHLFNLMGDDGRPRYCEGDGFIPGDRAADVFEVDGWKVGLAICYDLRFPEFFTALAARATPDVLAVPSAFTKGTGLAHWELLLRARAVERQAYVYAANQVGVHGPGKETYGHSVVIDPWGVVLADTGDRPGFAVAKLARAVLTDVRGKLPALANRRPELYSGGAG